MSTAFDKFKEKATASDGLYLKPSEIEGTQRFKIIPWAYLNKVKPIHFFYEGWVETGKVVKGKKESKPIRFDFNDEGEYDADPDTIWAVGDYGLQTPSGAFVCVVADMKRKTVNILSGKQKTLIGPLSDYITPSSERFIKDWTAYDILITKDDKTSKFTCERDKIEDKNDRIYPKWLQQLLSEFRFSMESFMACEKTEVGEGTTYDEVLNLSGDGPVDADDKPSKDDNYIKEWRGVKTPKGKTLSEYTLDDLNKFKTILDEKGKTDTMLYHAIVSAIADLDNNLEGDDIPF